MPNDWFRFKQFTIQQGHAAMKVGIDGVLLGAWATTPDPGSKMLDVGTGTGLIALMMAQRTMEIEVDALEIEPASAGQAKDNFQNSPWKERIHCIQSSFQDYASQCKIHYEQIICNPPFFSDSLKTSSREKNLARHDDSLSLEDFFRCATLVMKKTSVISLILPIDKETLALEQGIEHQLHCIRLTRVKPTPGKAARRILMEFSFNTRTCKETYLTIETETRHIYTGQFKSLVDKFYLYL